MSRDEAALHDIHNAAQLAVRFVEGMSQVAFLNDPKTQASLLYQITVIGEAARRLSEDFQATHSDIPWRLIIGMRNRVIHGYDDVDVEEV